MPCAGNNRGKTLVHNTSGLGAIRFAWRPSRRTDVTILFVCVSWHTRAGEQRQRSLSINKHGKTRALELAIAARRHAGYKVPSTSTALRALARFFER